MAKKKNIKILGIGGGTSSVLKRLCHDKYKNIDIREIDNYLDKQKADDKNIIYDKDELENYIKGSDIVFIISCLGGEVGSGSAIEIASLSKSLSILTISLISLPFSFEGKQRNSNAINAMNEIVKSSDCVITIKYDKILQELKNNSDVVLHEVWQKADDLLYNAISGFINLTQENDDENSDDSTSKTTLFKNIGNGVFLYNIIKRSDNLKDEIQYVLNNINYNTENFKLSHYIAINISGDDLSPDEYSFIKNSISSIVGSNTVFKIYFTRDKKIKDEIIIKMYFFGSSIDDDSNHYENSFSNAYSVESQNIMTNSIEDVVYVNDIRELFPIDIQIKKDDTKIPTIIRYS